MLKKHTDYCNANLFLQFDNCISLYQSPLEPYVFYFMLLKSLFWEENHRLCQTAKGPPALKRAGTPAPSGPGPSHATGHHFPHPATNLISKPAIPSIHHPSSGWTHGFLLFSVDCNSVLQHILLLSIVELVTNRTMRFVCV